MYMQFPCALSDQCSVVKIKKLTTGFSSNSHAVNTSANFDLDEAIFPFVNKRCYFPDTLNKFFSTELKKKENK